MTIALAICTKSLVMLLLGKNPADLPAFSGDAPVEWGGARIHPQTFWIVGTCAVVMLAMHGFFERTTLGRAMRAAAAEPDAARAVRHRSEAGDGVSRSRWPRQWAPWPASSSRR